MGKNKNERKDTKE